jgi:O-antigen/teichoic acid export membrane protein
MEFLVLRLSSSVRFRRLSKEGFWIVLGHAMAVGGSLIGVRLITELLDPVAYGELALATAIGTLVNLSILGPIGNGIMRFYAPAAEGGDISAYWSAGKQLVFGATRIAVLLALLTAISLLLTGQTHWIAIITMGIIFAVLNGYNMILHGIQSAVRQRHISALHQGIEPWIRYLGSAALMVWLGANSTVAMTGYLVAIIAVLTSQYVFVRKIRDRHTEEAGAVKQQNWSRQIYAYSWPFAVFGIFVWAQLASDRWALEVFTGTQDVGLYAALFQLGYYPIAIVTGMVAQFLAPIFYQRAGDASDRQRMAGVRRLGRTLTGLALGATAANFLIAFLFHRQLFRILVAGEYGVVSYLLPWMVLAAGLFAAGQVLALNLMSEMRPDAMVSAKIVTALFGIALNFAGAYWYGIAGVVVASVLFSGSYFFWMAVVVKHEGDRCSSKDGLFH